jgi:hypothetical protein
MCPDYVRSLSKDSPHELQPGGLRVVVVVVQPAITVSSCRTLVRAVLSDIADRCCGSNSASV